MKNLFETTLRVPLLVRFPGGEAAGTRVAAPVSLVDVAPTVLDAVRVARPAAFGGESLLPAVAGEGRRRARPLFASLYGQAWAVRQGDLKLVRNEAEDGAVREELYDLAADPAEAHDLATSRPHEAQALSQLLARWRRLAASQRREAARPFEKGEGLRETLEALGYL
jgi:arylsulfatase A-like enzyme